MINIWLIVLPLMLRSSGFTWINLTSDNSNIGFNLPIIILFPIINWIADAVIINITTIARGTNIIYARIIYSK